MFSLIKQKINTVISMLLEILVVVAVLWSIRCVFLEALYLSELKQLVLSAVLIVFTGTLFKNKKRYYACLGLLLTMFSSIFVIKLIRGEPILHSMFNDLLLFATGLINAILLIGVIGSHHMVKKARWLLIMVVFCPVVLLWGYYWSSEAWVSPDTLMAILQTNVVESAEYLADFISWSDWVLIACLFLIIAFAALLPKKLELKGLLRASSVVVVIALAGNIFCTYLHRRNVITDIAIQTQEFIKGYRDFEIYKHQRKEKIEQQLANVSENADGVYVLVIGESQNRDHMSAYGYERDTTPWLKEMKEDKNLVFFNNAYSCHAHTVHALTYALTAKNQYNGMKLSDSYSLIEVAEAAGFDTVWVSNQIRYSAWETPIMMISNEANQQYWNNADRGEDGIIRYDMDLVDKFDEIKFSDKMLIVVHLMGSHWTYRNRYPKDFEKYTGNTLIDEYDNSIHYNDVVMKNLYEKISKIPSFKGMIYFSDHADAVKKNLGHNASNFVPEMTHIPLYMYFSNDYLEKYKAKVNNLLEKVDNIITNDLLFNIILGIMDIKVDDVYEAHNDITEANYDVSVGRFKTLYGNRSVFR